MRVDRTQDREQAIDLMVIEMADEALLRDMLIDAMQQRDVYREIAKEAIKALHTLTVQRAHFQARSVRSSPSFGRCAPSSNGRRDVQGPRDILPYVTLTQASSIRPRPVKYLWDGRIAIGALSLCGGREGLGKSTLNLTVLAAVTRGRLKGENAGTPRNVIIVASEDAWDYTIVPRLMAADADLTRGVHC